MAICCVGQSYVYFSVIGLKCIAPVIEKHANVLYDKHL